MPSFLKTPMDLTIRTGTMARLECAAEGHPSPQIAWQKDGGTDFPAARERRMHVMPDDDIFFIANVKTEDMGVYSCTAQNAAGSLSANATLTVLGESCSLTAESIAVPLFSGWLFPLKLDACLYVSLTRSSYLLPLCQIETVMLQKKTLTCLLFTGFTGYGWLKFLKMLEFHDVFKCLISV